jgi:hypothetical protein
MPAKFGAPAYWRVRASSARALAKDLNHPEARLAMLTVAGPISAA